MANFVIELWYNAVEIFFVFTAFVVREYVKVWINALTRYERLVIQRRENNIIMWNNAFRKFLFTFVGISCCRFRGTSKLLKFVFYGYFTSVIRFRIYVYGYIVFSKTWSRYLHDRIGCARYILRHICCNQ